MVKNKDIQVYQTKTSVWMREYRENGDRDLNNFKIWGNIISKGFFHVYILDSTEL